MRAPRGRRACRILEASLSVENRFDLSQPGPRADKLSPALFTLAATAVCFSGWTLIDHPGLTCTESWQYAYVSFHALNTPLTGILFLKRQWLLGPRHGFTTPGAMMAYDVFQSFLLPDADDHTLKFVGILALLAHFLELSTAASDARPSTPTQGSAS